MCDQDVAREAARSVAEALEERGGRYTKSLQVILIAEECSPFSSKARWQTSVPGILPFAETKWLSEWL